MPSLTDIGRSWWRRLEWNSRHQLRAWHSNRCLHWICHDSQKRSQRYAQKLIKSTKTRKKSARSSKHGKQPASSSIRTKKAIRSSKLWMRSNYYWMISWLIFKLCQVANMWQHSCHVSGIGNKHSIESVKWLMCGFKSKRNGKIWRVSSWAQRTSGNNCEKTPKNSIKMTKHTRRSWNKQPKIQISMPVV